MGRKPGPEIVGGTGHVATRKELPSRVEETDSNKQGGTPKPLLIYSQVLQLKGLYSAFRSVGNDHVQPLRNKESIPNPTNTEFTRSSKQRFAGQNLCSQNGPKSGRGDYSHGNHNATRKNSRRGPKANFNRDYITLYYIILYY